MQMEGYLRAPMSIPSINSIDLIIAQRSNWAHLRIYVFLQFVCKVEEEYFRSMVLDPFLGITRELWQLHL